MCLVTLDLTQHFHQEDGGGEACSRSRVALASGNRTATAQCVCVHMRVCVCMCVTGVRVPWESSGRGLCDTHRVWKSACEGEQDGRRVGACTGGCAQVSLREGGQPGPGGRVCRGGQGYGSGDRPGPGPGLFHTEPCDPGEQGSSLEPRRPLQGAVSASALGALGEGRGWLWRHSWERSLCPCAVAAS